jgi:osmoprotectant transport system substrate-binding protein
MRRIAVVALTLVLTSCVEIGSPPPEIRTGPIESQDPNAIVVGSFDFTESRILAHLYALALREEGLQVDLETDVGPREVLSPALEQGLIDIVPEYLGTALQFMSIGRSDPTPNTAAAHASLKEELAPRGLEVLAPAPAQDQNGFVVRPATAEEYDLENISDLEPVAKTLRFGGPPECPTRPFCLQGLEQTYDLDFESFVALDTGGPVTVTALQQEQVDVALLFTTDPHIASGDFVLLEDDRRLQPAENIAPIVRSEVVDRHGRRVATALDAVSARLTTAELSDLNAAVDLDGRSPEDVAREWFETRTSGSP